MVKTQNDCNPDKSPSSAIPENTSSSKSKQKNQGKKRKRHSSESSNDDKIILPDNALETERNVHASAMKNNLDETSVRKIIKKVVTNDHVLALVKLREEEEDSSTDDKKMQPKLTRAKVKELKKVSPKSAAWNLENLELTPIKHIPVKTRPEVKALIAQELPEDEDDEEYEPTHDDVLSDDDHVESCSDLDSQPRTPATPASLHADSPRVLRDGPFKVPQEVSTARRKLDIEEEATIALRTRSKLSLSATSIEHIESTFVPPDELPIQDVDEVWNQFLNECLNPASTSKHEDDDETDPEYNVAADPDAQDEDEESLSNSLIKISKKELNDLVTELFNIMPEAAAEEPALDNLANSVLTDNSQTETSHWEGKTEPVSDDDTREERPSKRLEFENKDDSRNSLSRNEQEQNGCSKEGGKEIRDTQSEKTNVQKKTVTISRAKSSEQAPAPRIMISSRNKRIEISIEENPPGPPPKVVQQAPPSLRSKIKPASPETVHIRVEAKVTMTPEQQLILEQQLRQHVQLATSNFLQLYVHPVHWKLAPTYKEYLTSLNKIAEGNPKSVVNVCNLKPAHELLTTWENSVSGDTPENRAMIEFIQNEVDRSRRRLGNNSLYVGEFHETFKKVVSNSPVFLYPYLLPAVPYRPDAVRRFAYLHSEDALIVLGLHQFWQYVESNPSLYKLRARGAGGRSGLAAALQLVVKHMFPWVTPRLLAGHVHAARAAADRDNPIVRYFKFNEVPKTQHRILPYNPKMTLYEHPEHEMPKIWVRYLAKTSKRFRNYLHKRPGATGRPPEGVNINPGITDNSNKTPLPIDFTKQIINHRATLHEIPKQPKPRDRFDINIQRVIPNNGGDTVVGQTGIAQNAPLVAHSFYRLVETSTGAFLLPLHVTEPTNDNAGAIATPVEFTTAIVGNNLPESVTSAKSNPKFKGNKDHCSCCVLLRKICKERQSLITEYFRNKNEERKCDCNSIKYPKISNRLRLLVNNHKKTSEVAFKELEKKLDGVTSDEKSEDFDFKDMAYVLTYQLKLFTRASMSRRIYVKQRVKNLLARFDLDSSDPTRLATDLFKVLDVELVDLYLDFLTFLTPEQADRMDVFKDYFTRTSAKNLMDRVENQVQNKDTRHKILSQLKGIFSDRISSSCEMCSGLLHTMEGYPSLARYTFNLFPHRKETREQVDSTPKPARVTEEQNDLTYYEPHNTMDYEADQSSFGEDSDALSIDLDAPTVETNEHVKTPIKMEPPSEGEVDTTEATITKMEREDYDSDTSMSIVEADNVKSEQVLSEWRRDEDKIVLEILQEHLTPEERKDKTILELLEEKNVYGILSERLKDRSLCHIKERVMYLLTVLVLSEG